MNAVTPELPVSATKVLPAASTGHWTTPPGITAERLEAAGAQSDS